ncbi:hypothetical protein F3J20_06295 [Paraburkholderia sp. Cy-641]|uniref:hypothetical protein n=1 Tax=Paraburkholderia sp. Cy-641 TaxID=2608337 RepID=UPI00141D87CE|nr:hypothetical protein [Paraburkholderia sp. Cy-641]NIF77014.1 hypothetical protein [Paraburkholderia sp. Cy-641]
MADSLGAFLVSVGLLVLDDPEGKRQQFKYAGFGMGISVPIPKLLHRKLTLPQITLKGREIAGTGSTTDFPSNGIVYETAACHGNLTPQKLEGGAIYFDGSAGLLYGTDVTVLLCGIKPELLEMAIMIQSFMALAVNAAPAVIVVRGVNEGLQEGLGGGLMPGQIIWKGTYDNDS